MAVVDKWRSVASRALQCDDPWAIYALHKLPTERCKRYRYSPYTEQWTEDIIEVKIQLEVSLGERYSDAHDDLSLQPFARGAMRECFRMKKLSSLMHDHNWKKGVEKSSRS